MANPILSELVEKERYYLNLFFDQLNIENMDEVLQVLLNCEGTIIMTGVGKSGLIAKKIADTMTSTGTQALYLSPANALHGDIGIVKPKDVLVMFSKSGESDELLSLLPFVRNKDVKTIGIVSGANSRLSKAVDTTLELPSQKELCPFDMAPTTSTTIQAIVGDVLAITLMRLKNFTLDDFAKVHPAGRIGRRISMKVKDLMLSGSCIPTCTPDAKLVDTLLELTNKQCGCVLVTDTQKKLLGIFTDGDLRRALQQKGGQALESPLQELMVPVPRWIGPDKLAWDAMKLMESNQKSPIMVLPVLEEDQTVVGLIKMHDLVQSGI
ncbi:MAG: Arabinose 5-phosphate isomerase KdsD [Chlamydiae bacterium]|nr:Arabinose 5-phosphate isomerase KdsD [Chlamydiota bacterium]